jgi:hypothetical protein
MLGSFPKLYKAVLTTIGMRGAIYGSPISSQIIDEINLVAQSVGSDRTRTGEREFHSHGRGLYLPRALAPGTQTVWHRPPDCVFIWQSRSDQAMRDAWPGDCILTSCHSAGRSGTREIASASFRVSQQSVYPSDLSEKKVEVTRIPELAGFDGICPSSHSAMIGHC